MGAADTPLFAAEEAKKALIGLARDLRGLAYAFNTKTSYMMLFDWMYVYVCVCVSVYACVCARIRECLKTYINIFTISDLHY